MKRTEDIGNPRDWVEFEVGNTKFRTRRERTLLADSKIEKVFFKDKALGAHDIIKIDCEIFDLESKQWRKVEDSDSENIGRFEGRKLLEKINKLRTAEKDFHKAKS